MNKIRINLPLPTPYPLQADIARHPAHYKIIVAGRRAGKTHLASRMAIGGDKRNGFDNGLLDGKRVFLSSTSQQQADIFWSYLTAFLAPMMTQPFFYKNEVKRVMRIGNGQITVRTGKNPDSLRGHSADLLILDEAAYLHPNTWALAGVPMLADTDGKAVFISTPKRKNWYFQLYQKAVSGDNPRWHAWNFSTLENPHLSQSALEALTENMSDSDYKQEVLAQFLDSEGTVFRHIDEVCTASPETPMKNGRYVFGVDWAQINDFTVCVVMDIDNQKMVYFDRFKGVDFALQRARLMSIYEQYQPIEIIAESNSIGAPNIEALQREGLPVTPFTTTAISKPKLIESLVLAFDRHEVVLLDDEHVRGEFMAFERKVTPNGRSQYSAPNGLHDDIVIATALAWYGVVNASPSWLPVLA